MIKTHTFLLKTNKTKTTKKKKNAKKVHVNIM